jgi:hypothetical protein
MNYLSVFLATTSLGRRKIVHKGLIAHNLDEKSRDCKQRIFYSNVEFSFCAVVKIFERLHLPPHKSIFTIAFINIYYLYDIIFWRKIGNWTSTGVRRHNCVA